MASKSPGRRIPPKFCQSNSQCLHFLDIWRATKGLWLYLEGLSERCTEGRSFIWRNASLYPYLCQLDGCANNRNSSSPPPSPFRRLKIWIGAHRQGCSGSYGCEVLGSKLCQANLRVRWVRTIRVFCFLPICGNGLVSKDFQRTIDD